MTQKRPKTFDFQCTQRVEDRRVVEMGKEELKGRPRWDYFCGFQCENQYKSDRIVANERAKSLGSPKQSHNTNRCTGVRCAFRYDDENEEYVYSVNWAMKKKCHFKYSQQVVDYVVDLTEEVNFAS